MAIDYSPDRIERLLDAIEPKLRKDFLRMVAVLRDSDDLTTLAHLLETGRFEEAIRMLPASAALMGATWSAGFITAGEDAAVWLQDFAGIVMDFDKVNTRAVAAMQNNQLRLVQQFSESQRQATRMAITNGITRGANPIEVARDFKNSIGLAPSQQRAVINYRRALESGDTSALTRALRDKRFDGTVRRAAASGKGLTQDQIDKMVSRYSERAVAHRARVIARTEGLRSVHEGNREMFDQAIAAGQLDPNNVVQIWNTASDARVRDTHTTMNGQQQPFGTAFTSGGGYQLRFPGDPSAPPAETIQCRCTLGTRILTPEEARELAVI